MTLMREIFEAEYGFSPERTEDGGYVAEYIDNDWKTWQLAWRAAAQECARACDDSMIEREQAESDEEWNDCCAFLFSACHRIAEGK